MNISHNSQKIVKEWLNVHSQLKELQEDTIPNSQMNIDLIISDDEDSSCNEAHKKMLFFKYKRKSKAKQYHSSCSKRKKETNNCKKQASPSAAHEFSYSKCSSVIKNSTNIKSSNYIRNPPHSPVLKKHLRTPSHVTKLNHSPVFKTHINSKDFKKDKESIESPVTNEVIKCPPLNFENNILRSPVMNRRVANNYNTTSTLRRQKIVDTKESLYKNTTNVGKIDQNLKDITNAHCCLSEDIIDTTTSEFTLQNYHLTKVPTVDNYHRVSGKTVDKSPSPLQYIKSPILKSRMTSRKGNYSFQSKMNEELAQNINEESANFYNAVVNESHTSQEIDLLSSHTHIYKQLEVKSKNVEDLRLIINEDSSPFSYEEHEQIISSAQSDLEVKLQADHSCNMVKGSDWVKDIQPKTPEKHVKIITSELKSSTKKKIKRNGFADQLRRLLQSKQSSVSIWDHQISLLQAQCSVRCCVSPEPDSQPLSVNSNVENEAQNANRESEVHNANRGNLVHNKVVNAREFTPVSHISEGYSDHNFNSTEDFRKRLCFVKEDDLIALEESRFFYKADSHVLLEPKIKSNHINEILKMNNNMIPEVLHTSTDLTNSSPKTNSRLSKPSCARKLRDSLEINSLSRSPSLTSSLKTNFALPKKHICAIVDKVLWQTSVMISAICCIADKCASGIIEDGGPYGESNYILVIFGCVDSNSNRRIDVGYSIKLFVPWQKLEVDGMPYPVIFSSFYMISKSPDSKALKNDGDANKRSLVKVASWHCPCISDSYSIHSTCVGGKLRYEQPLTTSLTATMTPKDFRTLEGFSTVQDREEGDRHEEEGHLWTVLEAIELCGDNPEILVSVTITVKRIYKMKNTLENAFAHYLIIGQDPSGIFVLVDVPDRPLNSTLSSLLMCGINTVRTITSLSVADRITDAQNPALFSVIKSIQRHNNSRIRANKQLLSLLGHQLQLPLQSFCYKFLANLGKTTDEVIANSAAIEAELPIMNFGEFMDMERIYPSTRVSLKLTLLYYMRPYLYVTQDNFCDNLRPSESSMKLNTSHSIVRITSEDVELPSWMNANGTIMSDAVLSDVWNTRGSLVLDPFSSVQRLPEELCVPFETLLRFIPQLKADSQVQELVALRGCVFDVDTETAFSWPECDNCKTRDLCHDTCGNIKCVSCCKENVPIVKYSLQVYLKVETINSSDFRIKIKLFQNTITNLIHSANSNDNQYNLKDVLGTEIGPLICVVKNTEEIGEILEFFLVEMPY